MKSELNTDEMRAEGASAGLRRRDVVLGAAASAALAWLPAGVRAQAASAWPNKPIKLIVSFPPGGAADALARAIAPVIGESLGQQLVIENRPGANGNIGGEAAAKSPPDGYTFLMSSGSSVAINPLLYTKMSFDPLKELTPVASAARVLVWLMVHPSVPVQNVREFIAYAKANPGKLSYGTPGNGSSPHLATEMFAREAGLWRSCPCSPARHRPLRPSGRAGPRPHVRARHARRRAD